MRAVLKLEIIGNTTTQPWAEKIARASGGDFMPKPWVARLTGFDPKFGYQREFQNSVRDYTHANSVGSRGIWRYYFLDAGIYQVQERLSWKSTKRYFILVDDQGEYAEISMEEANKWLKKHTSALAS